MAFILAYCKENQNIAHELDARLGLVGVEFDHIAGDEITGERGLQAQIKERKEPVILLVSYNFLRSTECMYKALFMLQANDHTNQIQPVVIDGRTFSADGSYESIPTSFERVSNVIQYMNYWQERYLDLRKLKREATDSELLEKIDKQLKIVRSTSSEVGEFLRILRGVEYWTYDQLVHNDFELFFDTIESPELHAAYQEKIKDANIFIPELIEEEPDAEAFFNGSDDRLESATPITEFAPVTESAIPGTSNTESILPDDVKVEEVETVLPEAQEIVPEITAEIHTDETLEENIEEVQEAPTVSNEDSSVDSHHLGDQEPLLDRLLQYQKEKLKQAHPGNTVHLNGEKDLDQYIQSLTEEDEKSRNPPILKTDIIDDIFNEEEEDSDIFPIAESISPSIAPIFDGVAEEAVERGKNLIEGGNLEEGLSLIKTIVDRFPENIQLRFLYATFLTNPAKDYDLAHDQLALITAYDPSYVDAFILLGKLSEQREDWSSAKDYYEKVTALDNQQAPIYYRLGKIVQDRFSDQQMLALGYLNHALKIDPTNLDARFRYAVLLNDHLDKPRKSIEELEKVLSFDPGHSLAHLTMAQIYYQLDKMKKAVKSYQLAGQYDPDLKNKEYDQIFKLPDPVKKKKKKHKSGISQKPFSGDIPFEIAEPTREDEGKVKTKTVLITGATSGIGKATAELFAQHGYRLILTGRRTTRLETIQTIFEKKYSSDIKILPFDVRDPLAVKQAIEDLGEAWGSVDILINNAGLAKGFGPIHEGNIEDWDAMINTNVKGLLYMTRCLAPMMVKKRQGHIINISSSAGKEVYPNGNVYCATKHAVEALTKAMRIELHQYNVRVSQVSPGHVEETEFAFVRYEDKEKARIYEDFQPLRARDVAESIYFIATRPPHVNIQDIHLFGTQQANSLFIDRSGR